MGCSKPRIVDTDTPARRGVATPLSGGRLPVAYQRRGRPPGPLSLVQHMPTGDPPRPPAPSSPGGPAGLTDEDRHFWNTPAGRRVASLILRCEAGNIFQNNSPLPPLDPVNLEERWRDRRQWSVEALHDLCRRCLRGLDQYEHEASQTPAGQLTINGVGGAGLDARDEFAALWYIATEVAGTHIVPEPPRPPPPYGFFRLEQARSEVRRLLGWCAEQLARDDSQGKKPSGTTDPRKTLAAELEKLRAQGFVTPKDIEAYSKTPAGRPIEKLVEAILKKWPRTKGKKRQRTTKDVIRAALQHKYRP